MVSAFGYERSGPGLNPDARSPIFPFHDVLCKMQKKQKEPIQSAQVLGLHNSKHYHLHPLSTSNLQSV